MKNGVAVRKEREIILRRTPFARATASIGSVSDMGLSTKDHRRRTGPNDTPPLRGLNL